MGEGIGGMGKGKWKVGVEEVDGGKEKGEDVEMLMMVMGVG